MEPPPSGEYTILIPPPSPYSPLNTSHLYSISISTPSHSQTLPSHHDTTESTKETFPSSSSLSKNSSKSHHCFQFSLSHSFDPSYINTLNSLESRDTLLFQLPSPLPSAQRAKMVDWMIEVISKAECELRTLFLSVNLMDRFTRRNSSTYKHSDTHIMGVVSMMLSSKFEDTAGNIMDSEFMFTQVVHQKLSLNQMGNMEIRMLDTVEYWVNSATEIDYIGFYMASIEEIQRKEIYVEALHIAMANLYDEGLCCEMKVSRRALGSLMIGIKKYFEKNNNVEKIKNITVRLIEIKNIKEEELNADITKIMEHINGFSIKHNGLKNYEVYAPAKRKHAEK